MLPSKRWDIWDLGTPPHALGERCPLQAGKELLLLKERDGQE
jgi:hypothetical protein